MKKLYLTAFAILLASSFSGILHAQNLTISNWTNIPLNIYVKAMHKNKKGEPRHNEETFKLAPIKTPFKAGDKSVALANNGAGIHTFTYDGGMEVMEVRDINGNLLKSYFNGKSLPDFYSQPSGPRNAYETFFGVRLSNQTGEILRDKIDIVAPDGTALYHLDKIKLN